jgi:hypothetical protein
MEYWRSVPMLKLVFSVCKYWMMPLKQGKILAGTLAGPAVDVVVDGNGIQLKLCSFHFLIFKPS